MTDDQKPQQTAQAEHTNTSLNLTEMTEVAVPRKFLFKLILIGLGGAIVGVMALVAITLFLDGPEGLIGGEEFEQKKEVLKSPPTATEILTDEMAGKIETAQSVDPEALTQPQPALPTTAELESRDLEDEFNEDVGRKVTAVEKSLKLHFDKGASKVSKNLDKKKVLGLLAKKLDCRAKLPNGTKSVKAEMKISKTGAISNIKVTPGSAEPELAKCMRKKLGESKVLKPKDKAVAKVTVQFKLK